MRVSPSAQTLFSSPEKRNLVLGLLLVVATLALYNPVIHHPFVNFDDDRYVTDNIHVRTGLHWETVKWAFTSFDEANWHPLTWLSHALDCQIFGQNPAGHHYINVLLHALNAILLFWVLWRATGSTGRSWMVAALFALHPINVESVAWVAERKTVLSMLFFLLALGAYEWYSRRPSIGRYAAVAALFACGLMAKPMVITFPFLLLLWDYWPPQRTQSFAKLALEKLPLLALSAASAVITVKAQRAGEAIGTMVQYPLAIRIENAAISYVRYLGKALWPSALSPQYPYPEGVLMWQAIGASVLLLAITVLILTAGKQRRYLAVGWFWFLGTLIPMIGLVQVGSQAMADRYAYLPFVGLFIMVCWGLADLAAEKTVSEKIALAAAGCIALAAFSSVTFRQIGYWKDNVTLWSHAVAVTPGSFIAEDNLGGALLTEGKEEEAMPHFRAASALDPTDPMSRLNLAAYAQRQGHPQEAIDQYAKVLTMTDDPRLRATAFSDMGYALRDLGDSAHAKASFRAAVNLRPRTLRAWLGLGLEEQKSGNNAEAIKDYAHVVAIQSWDLGYFLLGRALQQNGQTEASRAAMAQARRLSGNFEQLQKTAESLMAK